MIPQLLLEEILLDEKDERDYYDKYGKEAIQAALSELRKSNEEILDSYPLEDMHEKIIQKGFAAQNSSDSKTRATKKANVSIWKYSAAAILIFALATPLVVRNFKSTRPTVTEVSDPHINIKGNAHHQIKLYRQIGDNAQLLNNGETARENDLIQITYTPGLYNFGVIFSVDGNGNLTRHFPENSWTAAKLEKTGEEVPLSFSYALDDAPDYECFIFVASQNEFNLSKLEKISKEKYSIDFLKKGSYLPKDCDGSIFILKKK